MGHAGDVTARDHDGGKAEDRPQVDPGIAEKKPEGFHHFAPPLLGIPVAAQGHEDVLQVHGSDVHIGLPGRLQLNHVPPDGHRLVPAHLVGGEHLEPVAHLVHHVVPAGDIAELTNELLGVCVFEDAALVQDDDPLKDRGGLLNDMGGDDEGAVGLGEVLQKELVEPLPHDHVQPGGGLVQDGDGGPAGQGDEDGHHGHLALGQLGDFFLGLQLELVQQPQRVVHVPVGVVDGGGFEIVLHLQVVGPGKQGGLKLPGEADVVESPLILPHRLAVVGDRAAVFGVLGGEDAQQGGFPRPVPADKSVDFPGFDGEVQVVEDLLVLVGFAQALGL